MDSDNREQVFNIADMLTQQAEKRPDALAVIAPHLPDELGRKQLTFKELDDSSSKVAAALNEMGFAPGSRAVLMVKPGLNFFIITFAMFKAAVIPVVVDPGMGLRRMMRCLSKGRPQGFIGVSKAQLLRSLMPTFFRNIKVNLTVGRKFFWSGKTLLDLLSNPVPDWKPPTTKACDMAAVLFTTGSTGPAKGVVYTHNMFRAQVQRIGEAFGLKEGEVDLPTFPLFALFDPALGVTAVLPELNPTKPAKVNPLNLVEPIREYQVSNLFASPAILVRLGEWAQRHPKAPKLNSLKRVISAGAPVSPKAIILLNPLLAENIEVLTPYGATEAVPITCIASNEILNETKAMTEQGFGMCVGLPLKNIKLKVIAITDQAIKKWSDNLILPLGEIGEFVVQGDVVSRNYFESSNADSLAKIIDDDNTFWHRMGDVGWQDNNGRLWFCGRKNHRVIDSNGSFFTIPCESIFNNHKKVARSALVGVGIPGQQIPVVIIETIKCFSRRNWANLLVELLALAQSNPRTRNIKKFLHHPNFPVDIRHNAKIFREKLARWATSQLKYEL